MNFSRFSILALISCLSFAFSNKAAYSIEKQTPTAESEISQATEISSEKVLRQQARAITVKIMAGESWGSGIMIQRKGQSYTVLTNAHVLRMGSNYKIQTPDGKIYQSQTIKAVNFNDDDLGLLSFKSSSNYAIASIAKSPLALGENTFAAGFPHETKTWSFTTGKVDYILSKSFRGGYQLGYSNDILQGMSGGPVLNQRGELVAINGRHKFPIWGNPFIFEDGSTPNLQTRNQFEYSSWAVPVGTFLHSAPQFSQGIKPPAASSFREIEVDSLYSTSAPQTPISANKPTRSVSVPSIPIPGNQPNRSVWIW
ncbi:trypsin-like peptidase domain-containing protein [Anabaena sp. UHCC 0187]|uniref:S1 family peptidase n=1 Tax=Anabaena sp. UHCC 0187 TaxID=2590018 RepID=UPI0014467486|nr:serine protease [Anabaena sp. UHCC 0187]MTJ13645.1 trypsin-like peptidase domain-containing protein [Anabaena sp. UHCC 0187]